MIANAIRKGGAMTSALDPTANALLNITATVDHDQAVLALTGEIDLSDTDHLLMCVKWYLGEPHITGVTLDLHALTFMDAAGIRTLVRGRRAADQLGKTFLIKNHHGHIAELIGILGLDKYLTDPTVPFT
jgi:anti-sigma B factor antagonist